MLIHGLILIYRYNYKTFFTTFSIRLGRLLSDKDLKYATLVKAFVKRDINNVLNT